MLVQSGYSRLNHYKVPNLKLDKPSTIKQKTFSGPIAQAFHALMRMVIFCGNFLSAVHSFQCLTLPYEDCSQRLQLPPDLPQITTAGIWPTVCLPQHHLLPLLFFPSVTVLACVIPMFCPGIRFVLIASYYKRVLIWCICAPLLLLHTSVVLHLSPLDILSLLPPVFPSPLSLLSRIPIRTRKYKLHADQFNLRETVV